MEEKAAEYAGELAALEGLVADLGPLAGLLPERVAPEQDFNLFELLNQWWQEDVHSRCLTWLLDPQGSHGAGVYFLENFLLHTAERSASLGTPTIAKGCIRGGAWSDATSQREWYAVLDGASGWLDILLVNEGRKIICAIENKIFSPESGRQLTFYQKALERDYCGFARHYVFLSPTGMAPVHSEDRAFWTPVSYSGVLELVEQMVAGHAGAIGEDIRWFLRQYAGTLRRNIMPVPDAVQKRAREIYIAHREVIEMVCQHKPAYTRETSDWLRAAIEQQKNWQFSRSLTTAGYLRFGSVDWKEFAALQTGTEFQNVKDLLQFEFRITDSSAQLRLALYRGEDETVRQHIFDAAQKHQDLFVGVGSTLSPTWMLLHEGENILSADDYAMWDDQEVRQKMMDWVEAFAGNEFPRMNGVIVKCLQEYETQQNGASAV